MDDLPATALEAILEHIGEGVGVIDTGGELTWTNASLRLADEATRDRFVATCRRALRTFNQAGRRAVPLRSRPGRRFSFDVGRRNYEVMVSIAAVDDSGSGEVSAVVGVMWDVTRHRRLQSRIDAIDAAGSELLRIDSDAITRLNLGERLRLLEDRIVRAVRELLRFDHFEIRLIDRETKQLELVYNIGLKPLRIGHVIYAREQENGICGWVAATGKSYICRDVANDLLYTEGLEGALSTLTVPLRLHDRVVGVFNIESCEPKAFDDIDRRLAEIFGRYIAMAMHILDLMVVERYTTNEQVTDNVVAELSGPIDEIGAAAATLHDRSAGSPEVREQVDRIVAAVAGLRRRIETCASGPRSILGAEQELERIQVDPRLAGKRVLIADNEDRVRTTIGQLLARKGCDVTLCSGGAETIDLLHAARGGPSYDLVISDIRMPDRNGYEVFRTSKELSPKTPVILITGFGYDPHHSIVRANQEGLETFLFKPIQATALLEAVEKAILRV